MLRHHSRPKSQPPIKLSEAAFSKHQSKVEPTNEPKKSEQEHWSKMIEKYDKSRAPRFASTRNGATSLETLEEHQTAISCSSRNPASGNPQLNTTSTEDDDDYEPDISPLTSSGSSSSAGSSLASSTLSLSSVSSASTVMAVGGVGAGGAIESVSVVGKLRSTHPIKQTTIKDSSSLGSDEESSSNSSSCSSSSGISSIDQRTAIAGASGQVAKAMAGANNPGEVSPSSSCDSVGQLEQEVEESLKVLVSSVVASANNMIAPVGFDVLMVKEVLLDVPYELDLNNNDLGSSSRDIISMSRRHIFNALTHAQRVGQRESSWKIELHLSSGRIDDLNEPHIRWFKQQQQHFRMRDDEMIVLARDIIDCLVEHEIVIWLIRRRPCPDSKSQTQANEDQEHLVGRRQPWVAAPSHDRSSGSIIKRADDGPIKRVDDRAVGGGDSLQFACRPGGESSSQVCGNLIGITADYSDTDQQQQQQQQQSQVESVIWLCSNELEAEQAREAWVEFSRRRHLERLVDGDRTRMAAIKSANFQEGSPSSSGGGGGNSLTPNDAIYDRFSADNLAGSVQVASDLEQGNDVDNDDDDDEEEEDEEEGAEEDDQQQQQRRYDEQTGRANRQPGNIVLAGHEPEAAATIDDEPSSLIDSDDDDRPGQVERSTTSGQKTDAKVAEGGSAPRMVTLHATEAANENNNGRGAKRTVNKLVNGLEDDDQAATGNNPRTTTMLRRTTSVFNLNEKPRSGDSLDHHMEHHNSSIGRNGSPHSSGRVSSSVAGAGSGGGVLAGYYKTMTARFSSNKIIRSLREDQAGLEQRPVSVATKGEQPQRTLLKIGSTCDLSSSGHQLTKSKQTVALRPSSPVIKLPTRKQTAGHPQQQQQQQPYQRAAQATSVGSDVVAPIVKPRMSILKRQVAAASSALADKRNRDKLEARARPPPAAMSNKQQQVAQTATRADEDDNNKCAPQRNIDRNRMHGSRRLPSEGGGGQPRPPSTAHGPTNRMIQPEGGDPARQSKRSLPDRLEGNGGDGGEEPTFRAARGGGGGTVADSAAVAVAAVASIDQLNDSSKCSSRLVAGGRCASSSSSSRNNCAQVVVVSSVSSKTTTTTREPTTSMAADEYTAPNEITLTATRGSTSQSLNEIESSKQDSQQRKLSTRQQQQQQQQAPSKQPVEVCKELQLDSQRQTAVVSQRLSKIAQTKSQALGEQQAKQTIVSQLKPTTTASRRKAVHSLANCELLARHHHNQQSSLSTRDNEASDNASPRVRAAEQEEQRKESRADERKRRHQPEADNGDANGDQGEHQDDDDNNELEFVSTGSLAREQAFERLRQRASCYDITRLMSKNSIIQNQLARLRATGPSRDSLSASSNDLRQRKPAELLVVAANSGLTTALAHNKRSTDERRSGANSSNNQQECSQAKGSAAKQELSPSKRQANNKRMSMIATGSTKARLGSDSRDDDRSDVGEGIARAQVVSLAQLRKSVSSQLAAGVEQRIVNKCNVSDELVPNGSQSTGSRRGNVPVGGVAVLRHQALDNEPTERDSKKVSTNECQDSESTELDTEDPLEEDEDDDNHRDQDEVEKVAEEAKQEVENKETVAAKPTGTSLSKFNLLRQSFNQKTISSMLKFSSRASLRMKASKPTDKAGDLPDIASRSEQEEKAGKKISSNELALTKHATSKTSGKLEQQQHQQIAALDSATLMLYNRHMQQRQQQQQQLLQQQQQYAIQWQQHQMYIQHQHHHQQRQQLAFMANHYVTHQQHQMLAPPGVQIAPQVAFGGYSSAASSMYALGSSQLHNAQHQQQQQHQLMMAVQQQQALAPPTKTPTSSSVVGGILRKSILKSSSSSKVRQDVARMVYAAPTMPPLEHKHHYAHPPSQLPASQHHQHMVPLAVNHHSSVNIVYGTESSAPASYKQQRNPYGLNEFLGQVPKTKQPAATNPRASSLGASMRKTVKSILINRTSDDQAKKKEIDKLKEEKPQHHQQQKTLKSALKSSISRGETSLNLTSDGSDGDHSNSSTLESLSSSSGRFDEEIIAHEQVASSYRLKSALKKTPTTNGTGNNLDENSVISTASTTDDSSTSSTSSDTNFKRTISARCSRRLTKSPPRQPDLPATARASAKRKNVTFSTKLTSIQ